MDRVNKDYVYYKKEYESQSQKVEKIKADGKDASDIKQQEMVLQETETMLPDCEVRIKKAASDLQDFVDQNQQDEAIQGTELLAEVLELLKQTTC